MKKIIMMCMTLAVWVSGFAVDNNTLSIAALRSVAGERNVVLTVNMDNRDSVSDLQFDIVLPAGVSVATDTDGNALISANTRRGGANAHAVSTMRQTDGSLRVVCTSSSGTPFAGNTGAVLTISVNLDKDISVGDKTILLKNIVLSDRNGSYTPRNVRGTLTVQAVAVLTFLLDGQELSRDTVVVGSPISAPTVAERAGYTFSGWGEVPSVMPNYNLTLSATFTINRYVILFVADGVEVNHDTIAFGTPITAPAAPQKEGYTFTGWGDVDATVPAHNCTYTAQYSPNSYALSFVADGNLVRRDSVVYNTALTSISTPQAPAKDGYTFLRWDSVPAAMPAHDVMAAAVYSVNSYILRFVADGVEVNCDTIEYGVAVSAPETVEKEGYTFLRWDRVPATMPAHDMECVAVYAVNKYAVTFLVDGVVFEADTVCYGDTIVLPEDPVKDGYTFVGWQVILGNSTADTVWIDADYVMPARDVAATAVFIQDAIRGDVNGDDVVNSSDAVAVYNVISAGGTTGGSNKADINGDGVVNSSDVVEVFNIIAAAD